MSVRRYPVVWCDSRYGTSTAGQLALLNRRAILSGVSGSEYRVTEFDASEVERLCMASPATRLLGKPTLVIGLRDRGQVLIAQFVGIGLLAEVADVVTSWLTSP